MASLESLDDLLQEELKDLYDAEKQLTKALPKMVKKSTAGELKEAFEEHLRQTEQHVERLEQVFELMEMPARGKKCKGMQNLIAEGDEMISEAEDDSTRDALLIAAAQKVEHYEIAGYGTVRTWASLLGKDDVAGILEETLDEEKDADQKLTTIAESFVNQSAAEETEEPAGSRRGGRAASTMRAGAGRPVAADRGRAKSGRKRSR
jgi:ferritin-like metal-binding protein YciE